MTDSARHAAAIGGLSQKRGRAVATNDTDIPYKVMSGNVGSVGKRELTCRFDGGTPVALESGQGTEIHT